MASATQKRPAKTPSESQQRFIDGQIRRVRRSLKFVDLTAGLLTLVIGVVVYLLAMALLEHWVVPGGWGPTTRVVLFVGLLLGIAWQSWRVVLPLAKLSINPAYAAQTIEQSTPTLKNSLLNLLLLRGRRRHLSANVFQAIEQQAAQGLSKVSLETVVDRSAVLRLGYVLVAVVALAAVYHVLSPKDPFASAGRVLLPWSDIPVPSRVQILDVQPGDASVAQGEQLKISAEIIGIDPDTEATSGDSDSVRLLFSTTDGQLIDQAIPMRRAQGGLRFECRLPGKRLLGDSQGVQNDLKYRIEAGDARSEWFRVEVFAHPTMVVQSIRYDYPAYTGYPSREVENSGDIQAVEGTRVTIRAMANQPIGSAHIDLQADGSRDVAMTHDDRQATAKFSLGLREDRRTPRYNSYMLRYTTTEGRKNRQPPKYQIEILRDYAPEIQLLGPEEEMLDVPLDELVEIRMEARDPDFALSQVSVLGTVEGRQRLQRVLLSENQTGRYVGSMRFTPAELGLQAGDVLEYWGEARDNRQPEPNLAFTRHQKIRVLGPLEQNDDQQQGENQQGSNSGGQAGDESDQQEGNDQQEQPGGTEGGGGEQSDSAEQQEGEGNSGESADATDSQAGEQNSGNGEGESTADQNSNSKPDEGDPGGQMPGESGDPSAGENQPGDQQPGDQQPGGAGETPSKVSAEGDDDGTAFERISEHFSEQGDDASEQENRESQGGGAEGESSDSPDDAGQPQQDETAPGGEMQQQQGPPGGGENPGENQGAPDPQGGKQPRDKSGDPAGSNRMDDQEPPAQGEGEHESDSKGQQGGDRSGEGQEGGGQKAEDEGTGGAGSHQPADQGAGAAPQPGESASADGQPGDGPPSETPTGQPSQDTPGEGSKQSPNAGDQPGGQQPGGQEPGAPDSADESEQNGKPSPTNSSDPAQPEPGENNSQDAPPGDAGQPSAGGMGNSDSAPPPPAKSHPATRPTWTTPTSKPN